MSNDWILDVLGLRKILDAAGVEMPERQSVKFTGQTAVDNGAATRIPAPPLGPAGATGPGGIEPAGIAGPTGAALVPVLKHTVYLAGASGTHNFTGDWGLVVAVGGGGGGGGVRTAQANNAAAGGGGGAGGILYIYSSGAFPASVTYAVGAGGTGGADTTNGAAGVESRVIQGGFEYGGTGGLGSLAGPAADETSGGRTSPAPGAGSDGFTSGSEPAGMKRVRVFGSNGQHGWYGAESPSEVNRGGIGGACLLGAPGRQVIGTLPGEPGRDYGGGGGGGVSTGGGGAKNGGDGAGGLILVLEFD